MSASLETCASKESPKNKMDLFKLSGVYFTSALLKKEIVEDALNYKPSKGDLFLSTYPKSGTTWTQYILWCLMHKGEPIPNLLHIMTKGVPFLELLGSKGMQEFPTPRMMKSHLAFTQIPHNPEAKYIYIARNAKDVCVSYYHFMKQLDPEFKDGTLNEFFEMYLDGKISYGKWYDHVYSWYLHKDDPNVLLMTYEWMKDNHAEAVRRIASLVGKQYRDELDRDPSLLNRIVENTTFKAMKNIPVDFMDPNKGSPIVGDNQSPASKIEFFRKGAVGDWKNFLSQDQERRLNEALLSQSNISSLMTLWENLWTMDDLVKQK